jgi:hypothetical protein
MFMSRLQNAGHYNIKIAKNNWNMWQSSNSLFEKNRNKSKLYLRVRLDSGNACYRTGRNRLLTRLPSKNVKNKTYKAIILPVFCICLSH